MTDDNVQGGQVRRQEVMQKVAGPIHRKYRSRDAKARTKGRKENKAEEE